MLTQYYKISHCVCLNNFLQVWLISNQRDPVNLFRYINWANEVPPLVRERTVVVDINCLMRLVILAAEAVGIWTKNDWDIKRENSLYIW